MAHNDDDDAPTEVLPERHGAPWQDDEDELLIDRLRAGLTTDEIAEEFSRTVASIRARAAKFLPHDVDDDQDRVTALRRLLAGDPDYPWRQHREASKGRRVRRLQQDPFDDEDLITIAEALCGSTDYHRIVAAEAVLAEINARSLWDKVIARRAYVMTREDGTNSLADLRQRAREELEAYRRDHLTSRQPA